MNSLSRTPGGSAAAAPSSPRASDASAARTNARMANAAKEQVDRITPFILTDDRGETDHPGGSAGDGEPREQPLQRRRKAKQPSAGDEDGDGDGNRQEPIPQPAVHDENPPRRTE